MPRTMTFLKEPPCENGVLYTMRTIAGDSSSGSL